MSAPSSSAKTKGEVFRRWVEETGPLPSSLLAMSGSFEASPPSFPPPDATREQIDAWKAANDPGQPEHEAPPIANGPSLMCNACGKVRINIFNGPFCRTCSAQIAAATGQP